MPNVKTMADYCWCCKFDNDATKLIDEWLKRGWKMIGVEDLEYTYRVHMSREGSDSPVYICLSHLRELTEQTLLCALKTGGSDVS